MKGHSFMPCMLYVGNLEDTTSEADLINAFRRYGEVVEVSLVVDAVKGRSRGFAFVTMSTAEAAQRAILALNRSMMGKQPLSVSEARTREARGGSYGGGRTTRRRFSRLF